MKKKMTNILKVMWAEDLPLETKKEFNVFKGLVEVRLVRNSPLVVDNIKQVEGTFSQNFRETLKKDGFFNKIEC